MIIERHTYRAVRIVMAPSHAILSCRKDDLLQPSDGVLVMDHGPPSEAILCKGSAFVERVACSKLCGIVASAKDALSFSQPIQVTGGMQQLVGAALR